MMAVELGARACWLVVAAGIVSGAISWWAFRRFSNRQALREAVNRIVAHLFELRLFASEPRLLLRSQRDLLTANARFLRQLARPMLVLLLPLTMLFFAMDAYFSRAPLQPGRAAIVTLHCKRPMSGRLSNVALAAPAGIKVETPPVHMISTSQIAWRVRPMCATEGELHLQYAGAVIAKHISSAQGPRWLAGGWNDPVSVQYPPAMILGRNWLAWYLTASLAGAVLASIGSRHASYL